MRLPLGHSANMGAVKQVSEWLLASGKTKCKSSQEVSNKLFSTTF